MNGIPFTLVSALDLDAIWLSGRISNLTISLEDDFNNCMASADVIKSTLISSMASIWSPTWRAPHLLMQKYQKSVTFKIEYYPIQSIISLHKY